VPQSQLAYLLYNLMLTHRIYPLLQAMKQYFGVTRIPNYWWFVKGVEGVTGVIMVLLMVIAYTLAHPWFRGGKLSESDPLRRLSGFNMFWYSHHLFVIHGVCLYITRTWHEQTVKPLSTFFCSPNCNFITQKLPFSMRHGCTLPSPSCSTPASTFSGL
jgi:hypothetical protein